MTQPRLLISDGRSQAQRRSPALSGDYFKLNEMRFEELLTMAVDYASMVKFYQLDLSEDGHWQQYFHADEVVLLANILSLDLKQLAMRFEQRLQSYSLGKAWYQHDLTIEFPQICSIPLDSPLLLARLLEYWLSCAKRTDGRTGYEITKLLESILRGLNKEMLAMLELEAEISAQDATSARGPSALPLLNTLAVKPANLQDKKAGSAHTVTETRSYFHAFSQAIQIVQNGVRHLLPQSMASQEHDPGSSLLITFIQLFQKLQIRLNQFGQAHLDFYYHQMLKMEQRPHRSDYTFIVIQPKPGVRQIFVEKATEFIAGIDKNQHEITYANEEAVTLNDAKITALHTLFFDQRTINRRLESVSCHTQPINALADGSDEKDHEKLPPLPLMGAPKPGERNYGATAARFGFAIASKTLLLREGQRRVRILLQYQNTTDQTIEDCLRRFAQENAHEYEASQSEAVRMNDIFVKLLRGMFRISLTTATGWYRVTEYRPEYTGLNPAIGRDCLSIEFSLPPEVAAICNYKASLHGDNYETDLPVARFEMTENEYRYPYDLLKSWVLRHIRLEVDVQGCRQLLLHNQIGQLSAMSPFMPFGPLPNVGSYLIVGCEEILSKQLDDAEIKVEWNGLPTNLGGIAAYYRGYAHPMKSGEVLASVSVLSGGKWIKGLEDITLFDEMARDDGSQSSQLAPDSVLSYQSALQFYKPLPYNTSDAALQNFSYTPATMAGLFKLTLEAPEGAFGHQEYPMLLAQILTDNARQKRASLAQALPNPPYTPQISSIVLNYKAHSTIRFEQSRLVEQRATQDKMVHLHPLGTETMVAINSRAIYQIPQYDYPANLFIGLQGTDLSGALTLYFYLREDSLPMTRIKDSGLSWWYLSGNSWQKLDRANIIDDSTDGFMTSGIVSLNLPDDINTNNTIMPAGVHWLRVSANEGMERFCSVYSVYAQALEVTWCANQANKASAVLPAMSITRSKQNIPGIDRVIQIRHSVGGKSAETVKRFRTRVSERLRHKNRALTASDYELLILEQFPEIHKVKCFANLSSDMDPAKRLRGGQILIVPLPYLNKGGHFNQRPLLSGHLIHEVQQFIETCAPPFTRVSVENPVYEEIQIRCQIKLKSGLRGGWYSNQINQYLCDFLSPWHPVGYQQHFGWCIREHDLISFLLDLDYVEAVTGFSMLHITPTGQGTDLRFRMDDNARNEHGAKSLYPIYPWSIAVPMNQHWIVLQDEFESADPKPVGINELRIGSTFIIPSRK
ncbi:baseplate J/gp47 family protein [Undibacterium sp. Ji49W]|uniref:baseplate J/gp47 family protein n=1 Tax=Undibacterium sp. Ji49W TaxID=3413040 RepID=UPI003BF3EF01